MFSKFFTELGMVISAFFTKPAVSNEFVSQTSEGYLHRHHKGGEEFHEENSEVGSNRMETHPDKDKRQC